MNSIGRQALLQSEHREILLSEQEKKETPSKSLDYFKMVRRLEERLKGGKKNEI